MVHFSRKYLREEVLPTPFCPGCYNGIVVNALFKALEELGVTSLNKFVFVSGIGCSSWIPSPHFKADTVHTLHGRAIPVATGIKLARPDLEVVVIAGDGDLASIGGNHLIHAARRNMDLVVILVNNLVYGMTRGQASPTTPEGIATPTTPYGNLEPPMDVAGIISKTNANYVARWCVNNFMMLKKSFKDVFSKYRKGFRFIEIWAPCVTYFVRYEGLTPGEKLKELGKQCVPLSQQKELVATSECVKVPVGIYKALNNPGYLDRYIKISRGGGGE